jgi:gamma-glutamyltranspeptidase/glutathione hydrolase
MRNFHFPGRSMVYGTGGMVATSHPAASLVGVDVLKSGGNAVDAAIAIAASLAVLEPAMTGIGGDSFALLWDPKAGEGKGGLVAMNAAGRAPKAATCEWYARHGIASIEMGSPHAVTVPGAIAGWALLLKDYGTQTFERLLAPAITLAERGIVVSPRVAFDWARSEAKLGQHAGARQHLLVDGRVPRQGELMRFPALAATLKAVARDGRDGFYQGPAAADMVATLEEMGGLHTLADFAAQNATYVTPIATRYGGLDVHQLPPSNQGITGLIMLNVLKELPAYRAMKPDSVERHHVLLEVSRLAYAARDRWVADPDQAQVPVEGLLSQDFARKLASRVDMKRHDPALAPLPSPDGTDTVYFAVADGNGMMVSFINSLFASFGSGIVARKSGVTLHNRGQGFRLDPKHPSAIAPGKRPMHTIIPAFATKDGRPHMAFGVMGGNFQPMGHVLLLSNMLDCGMELQAAIDAPRYNYENGGLLIEEGVPQAVVEGLQALGHKPRVRPEPWGGAQAIMRDAATGIYVGASDPRKDGCALGL